MRARRKSPNSIIRHHTVNGETRPITLDLPAPIDWERIGLRVAALVALGLSAGSVAWSTVRIGDLLHGGVGYAAAAVFDASWLVVTLLEWLSRYDPDRRRQARAFGALLLVVTTGALLWDGLLSGGLAAACVGAVVSGVAKVLWLALMQHVDRHMTPEDLAWVRSVRSEAFAREAVAGARYAAALSDARSAAQLLAAERLYGQDTATSVQPQPRSEQAPAAPTRSADTLSRAVEYLLMDAAVTSTGPVGIWPQVAQRADEAIAMARADGWSTREVHDAAAAIRRAVVPRPDLTPDAPGGPVRPRPDTTGGPVRPVPAQVGAPDVAPDIRTDAPQGPERARVPEQRPPSIAAGVRELFAAGHTDPETVRARLHPWFGDVNPETVARELRAARQDAREPGIGEGGYA